MTRNRNEHRETNDGGKSGEGLAPSDALTRRDFFKIGGGTAVIMGLATACGPGATPTALPEGSPAPTATAAASPVPASEGTGWFVYSSSEEGESLDPAIGYTIHTRWVHDNIYDSLFRFEGDPPELVDHLAESYEVSEDGLEWVFKLRQGVKFHDGSELTASDVVYSVQRMVTMAEGPSVLFTSVDPDKCEVIDDYTAKIVLKEVYGPFVYTLPWLYIVNEDLVRANEQDGDWGTGYLRNYDAGSGPFILAEYEPDVELVMPYFPEYWKGWPDKRLDGWRFEVHHEAATTKQLLASSGVHAADRLSQDDFNVLASYPNLGVREIVTSMPQTLKMNNQKEPTSNRDFRLAVRYALNYEAIIDGLLQGHATPMDSPLPPSVAGYVSIEKPYRDLDRARDYLERSGYDPSELKLTYGDCAGDPFQTDLGLLLQDSLKDIGIAVEVAEYPTAVAAGLWADYNLMSHFFPIWGTADFPDALCVLDPMYNSKNWGSWYSCSFYKNERVDELLDQVRIIPRLEDRLPIYEELQHIISEDSPDIWLFARHWQVAINKCVKDLVTVPAGAYHGYVYPAYLDGSC